RFSRFFLVFQFLKQSLWTSNHVFHSWNSDFGYTKIDVACKLYFSGIFPNFPVATNLLCLPGSLS
ncbi:MAG: hypothetical protein ACI376_05340, partial [Candidatus Bruticola sp.]